MMLVNMLLNSIGFKPKTTTQAILGIIIPVALVITTFVFVEYFVTASIIIAIAFPLFLWFYALWWNNIHSVFRILFFPIKICYNNYAVLSFAAYLFCGSLCSVFPGSKEQK